MNYIDIDFKMLSSLVESVYVDWLNVNYISIMLIKGFVLIVGWVNVCLNLIIFKNKLE